MDRFHLQGKVALVCGAEIAGGIARGLQERGATVVLAGAEHGALTEDDPCMALVRDAADQHGRLDILVNAAGGDTCEVWVPDWPTAIESRILAAYRLSCAARPELRKAGGGKIINVVPMASYIGSGRWRAFRTTRDAFRRLARNCATAWAEDNIQVNTIVPGYIDVAATRTMQAMPEFHGATLRRTAAGRIGTADDFAGVAAFLAGPASDFVTGAEIPVDGGLLWAV